MEFEEVENIGQRIKEIRKSKSITIQKLSLIHISEPTRH